MNPRYFGWLLTSLCFLPGCENYFGDVTPIESDQIPASNTLSLGAAFTNLDSVLYLRADRGVDLLVGYPARTGEANLWPVFEQPDLRIDLLSNEQIIAPFSHIPQRNRRGSPTGENAPLYTLSNNYDSGQDGTVLIAGETYTLRVDHPSLGVFAITQTMPGPVANVVANVSPGLTTDPTGNLAQNVTLTFEDASEENNAYLIQAITRLPASGQTSFSILYDQDARTEEPRIAQPFLLLADQGGTSSPTRTINLSFTASLTAADLGERVTEIRLTTISNDWFNFLSSYFRYQTLRPDLNDGFVEPFQVFSNVPDGFGYFVLGYAEDVPVE